MNKMNEKEFVSKFYGNDKICTDCYDELLKHFTDDELKTVEKRYKAKWAVSKWARNELKLRGFTKEEIEKFNEDYKKRIMNAIKETSQEIGSE